MDDIILPDSAFKYIILQRTEYVNLQKNMLVRLITNFLPFINYNRIVSFIATFKRKAILFHFNQDMQREYITIRDQLPKKCSRILDIGCGIAGIDIFLQNHYGKDNISFYLLDKSQLDTGVSYGFRQRGEFYNSLPIAKDAMVINGVSEKNITLLEATDNNDIAIQEPVDIALSFISWGFHYPVSTYLNNVYDLLSDEGILILDVRKGTDGITRLKEKFSNYFVICEKQKYHRVLFRKKRTRD